MKRAFLFSFAVVIASAGFTGSMGQEVRTYVLDKSHSSVAFKARHLAISNVNGQFGDYEATISVDPSDLSTLEASATVQIGSVDTGNERRDNHLRSDDFFDAENNPTMTFVSTGVRNIDGSEFELVGDLTIRGTTMQVVFEAELGGEMPTRDGGSRIAFEAQAEVNRFDYGLKFDRVMELGGLVVGENIRIILELEAVTE